MTLDSKGALHPMARLIAIAERGGRLVGLAAMPTFMHIGYFMGFSRLHGGQGTKDWRDCAGKGDS